MAVNNVTAILSAPNPRRGTAHTCAPTTVHVAVVVPLVAVQM